MQLTREILEIQRNKKEKKRAAARSAAALAIA